jgi:hypothetical protein
MNWRELLFVAGFGLAPVAIWFWRMDPLLDRHSAALQAQVEARMADGSARRFIHERDQMQAEWSEFRPLAEIELQNISKQLNPIVLQNRVLDVARRLDCTLRIEERSKPEDEGPPIFQISGSGTPLQVLDLLRHLERGEHRARFAEVTLVYEELSAESGYEAFFNGAFTIPSIPNWDETEIANMLGEDDEVESESIQDGDSQEASP